MRSVYISLPDTKTVQAFVEQLSLLEGDFDLVSGKYILDARSLMGIFTLDLSKPVQLRIYEDSKENMQAIKRFVVENKGAQTPVVEAENE